jgi:hypothetical protein
MDLVTQILSPETGLTYEWNGLHTLNVFDDKGKNIDCFSLDYRVEFPDIGMVYQAINEWEK